MLFSHWFLYFSRGHIPLFQDCACLCTTYRNIPKHHNTYRLRYDLVSFRLFNLCHALSCYVRSIACRAFSLLLRYSFKNNKNNYIISVNFQYFLSSHSFQTVRWSLIAKRQKSEVFFFFHPTISWFKVETRVVKWKQSDSEKKENTCRCW